VVLVNRELCAHNGDVMGLCLSLHRLLLFECWRKMAIMNTEREANCDMNITLGLFTMFVKLIFVRINNVINFIDKLL